MYAQLGELAFNLVGGLTDMTATREYSYAQQDTVVGKPAQQFMGAALEELELQLQFLDYLVDVVSSVAALHALEARSLVLPLIYAGDGLRGYYVITRVQEVTRQTDMFGRPSVVEFTVSLREWHETLPVEVASRRKRQDDAAQLRRSKPEQKTPPPTAKPGDFHTVPPYYITRQLPLTD